MTDQPAPPRDVTRLLESLNKVGMKQLEIEFQSLDVLNGLKNLILQDATRAQQALHANPLNRHGHQCFSQSDEDGLTLEILRRIDVLERGTFLELGVGNGLEANSIILLALGWKGAWVGNETLAVDLEGVGGSRFSYFKEWVTLENADDLARRALSKLGETDFDVVSIDLDGNDLHIARKLLEEGVRPRLWIAEYNGKFPPPVRFSIAYDPEHTWQGDDYFGASLTSLAELFAQHDYRLVCCNVQTGNNAFFVRNEDAAAFADVPTEIEALYVAPRIHVLNARIHRTSARTVRTFLDVL